MPRSRMAREAAALVERLWARRRAVSRNRRDLDPRPRVEREAQVRVGVEPRLASLPLLSPTARRRAARVPGRGGGAGRGRPRGLGATAAVLPGRAPSAPRGAARRTLSSAPPRAAPAKRASRRAGRTVPPGSARHREHELGVGRRAEVVHAELARRHAASARATPSAFQNGARRRPAGHQARDGREADRHLLDTRRSRRRRSRRPPAARPRPRAARSRPRADPRGRAAGASPARAITAASGRCTSAPTPTRSLPRSRASPRSWMSTTEMSARPRRGA